jgi:hypothetical protein
VVRPVVKLPALFSVIAEACQSEVMSVVSGRVVLPTACQIVRWKYEFVGHSWARWRGELMGHGQMANTCSAASSTVAWKSCRARLEAKTDLYLIGSRAIETPNVPKWQPCFPVSNLVYATEQTRTA